MSAGAAWIISLLIGYAGAFAVGYAIGWLSGRGSKKDVSK